MFTSLSISLSVYLFANFLITTHYPPQTTVSPKPFRPLIPPLVILLLLPPFPFLSYPSSYFLPINSSTSAQTTQPLILLISLWVGIWTVIFVFVLHLRGLSLALSLPFSSIKTKAGGGNVHDPYDSPSTPFVWVVGGKKSRPVRSCLSDYPIK